MTEFNVDQSRLAQVPSLSDGSHTPDDGGMCVMEAAAWVAGEEWSDHPQCVCPVIGAFLRNWNDALPSNGERDKLLRPLIPIVIGTRGSDAIMSRRATMAADWVMRVHTPTWLRLAGLNQQADALARLPEITDFSDCPPLKSALKAARTDAAAASAAAWDAASPAASAAASAAAWDAAWDALGPTIKELHASAADLVKRMAAVKDTANE